MDEYLFINKSDAPVHIVVALHAETYEDALDTLITKSAEWISTFQCDPKERKGYAWVPLNTIGNWRIFKKAKEISE